MKKKKFLKFATLGLLSTLIIGTTSSVYAASGHAFCVGMKDGNIDTTTSAQTASNNFSSMGYSSICLTSPYRSTFEDGKFSDGTKYMESQVIFLVGHGAEGHGRSMMFPTYGVTGSSLSNKYEASIARFNLKNVKLMTFAGCYTSAMADSISVRAYELGARNTLGWRKSVQAGTMNNWLNRFTKNLKNGNTIWDSMVKASSAIVVDNNVKDIGFYGSSSNTINSVDIPAIMTACDLEEDNDDNANLSYISENIDFANTNKDIQNLTNFMNSKYPLSKGEEYNIQIHEVNQDEGLYIIDFIRMINNAYTDLGYVVFVNNNKVESIADNNKTITLKNDTPLKAKSLIDVRSCKQDAISHLKGIDSSYNVIEQRIQLYLDVDTNKYYYKIFSTYEVQPGFVEVDCYFAEI